MRSTLAFATVSAAVLLLPGGAAAQPLPAGTGGQAPATAGATNVAGGDKFEAAPAKPAPDAKDATELQLQAGGLMATGNSRSVAGTSSGQFRLRREANQFSTDLAANYARAAVPGQGMETSVENYQGKVRYDRFLTERLAAFLSVSARRDRFQGLDLRLNVDPGLSYYLVDEANHQLWGELGYDLQLDLRRQEFIDAAPPDEPVADTETRHNGRVFTGYANGLNEAVTFKTGLEYIQGISDTESFRLNWDASLQSKIGGNFSLATTFTLKYDSNPLPDVEKVDTMTAVNLVYRLL
jgi:putative salt-induced outer membrane protein